MGMEEEKVKKIILLELRPGTGLGDNQVSACFRFAVPHERRVPRPGAGSAYRGSTAAELEDIASGAVIEETVSLQMQPDCSRQMLNETLESMYARRVAELAALPNINEFYGAAWNGEVWS